MAFQLQKVFNWHAGVYNGQFQILVPTHIMSANFDSPRGDFWFMSCVKALPIAKK
jgi:hypothetical protein